MRYATPLLLALAVPFFFLPWVEYQVDYDLLAVAAGGESRGPGSSAWMTLAAQNGLQTFWGDVTLGRHPWSRPAMASIVMNAASKRKQLSAPPLAWLYPCAVVAGVAVGFGMRPTPFRKYALAACCALAVLVPTGLAAYGLPIEKMIEEVDTSNPVAVADKGIFRATYQYGFYLAILLPAGGLMLSLFEPIGRSNLKKAVYDVDDEDYP